MKIVLICDEYPIQPVFGGIGVFTRALACGLAASGHAVTVVGVGHHAGEANDQGVRVVTLPKTSIRGIAWLVNRVRLLTWIRRRVRSGGIDIVEVPDHGGMLPFSVPRCPVVVRLHLSMTTVTRRARQRRSVLTRPLEKRTLSLHRNWIAVSNHVLKETVSEFGMQPDRCAVIYNPTCNDEKTTSPPAGLPGEYVLYAGTVNERKGAFVLAEAARSFLTAFPQLHLVYAGRMVTENGLPADDRIRQIVGPELACRTHCLGFLEHAKVLACMRQARVFALPSKLEACSLAPIEAMSCGTPLVYTTASEGPEVVQDGVTGLLADPNDSRDVALKVLCVLRDRNLAERLTHYAKRAVAERFSLSRVIDQTIIFYEMVRKES
ncbi:MAG: glycosyltransferase family 4 protein [Thermoguttaceae bacterium]|jgi:glycosyltransferase involved in cell wall biosynthesis